MCIHYVIVDCIIPIVDSFFLYLYKLNSVIQSETYSLATRMGKFGSIVEFDSIVDYIERPISEIRAVLLSAVGEHKLIRNLIVPNAPSSKAGLLTQ